MTPVLVVEPGDTHHLSRARPPHKLGPGGRSLPRRDWVDQRSGLDLRVGATVPFRAVPPSGRPRGIIRGPDGYDVPMSESSNEQTGQDDAPTETPDVGLIADEQLPEDLQPKKNPLAADPDDESDGPGDSGSEPQVDGMPDMGQPGA